MAWIEELIREGEKTVDEIEVIYVEGESVALELKKRKISLATSTRDCGLGIRTIHRGQIGSSSTSNPESWRECLSAAIASGKLATPQNWEGLPEPSDLPAESFAFDPRLRIDPVTARELLDKMLAGAEEHRAEVAAGSVSLSTANVTLANSHGLRYTDRRSGVSASLEAIHDQSTGYEFDHSWTLNRIRPAWVGERASFFASESSRGEDIPTGVYDVVLSPMAYADLLGAAFVPALNGRNVHVGRSKLADSLNKRVASAEISMYDDPHLLGESGSTWWDAEGVPTRRIDYVKEGNLLAFAYDLKTAYRYGQKTTGNASRGGYSGTPGIGHHNFIVDGNRDTLDDEKALYIHNIVGAHTANPMSGDFSVELANSFWIEGGEFQTPIRSAMFSGNVFTLHNAISGISRESRALGSCILPSVKIEGQRIIGK